MKIPVFNYPFIGVVKGKEHPVACVECYDPRKHLETPKGVEWGLCQKHKNCVTGKDKPYQA